MSNKETKPETVDTTATVVVEESKMWSATKWVLGDGLKIGLAAGIAIVVASTVVQAATMVGIVGQK